MSPVDRRAVSRMISSNLIGCAGWTVIFAAIGGVLYARALTQVDGQIRPWAAAVSALFLALGVANLSQLVRGYGRGKGSRRDLVERAAKGTMPNEDRLALATGTVRAIGAPLRAPVSGIECVAYTYTMFHETVTASKHSTRVPVYWGQASRPFTIQTNGRDVRVMGVPQIADAATISRSADAVARAREYVGRTAFTEIEGGVLAAVDTAGEMLSVMFTDDDGEHRRDWLRPAEKRDPERLILEETVLPVGAFAAASGQWSVARQGLVASLEGTEPIPVTVTATGGLDQLTGPGGVPHSLTSVIVTTVLLCVLGAGIAWAAVQLSRP